VFARAVDGDPAPSRVVGVAEVRGGKELEAREHQDGGDGQLLQSRAAAAAPGRRRGGGWRAARAEEDPPPLAAAAAAGRRWRPPPASGSRAGSMM
jgi:hypothetical protein